MTDIGCDFFGRLSLTKVRKTAIASKHVTEKEILSPDSSGSINVNKFIHPMKIIGIRTFTVRNNGLRFRVNSSIKKLLSTLA